MEAELICLAGFLLLLGVAAFFASITLVVMKGISNAWDDGDMWGVVAGCLVLIMILSFASGVILAASVGTR